MGIKLKLIILFVLVKIIPVVLILYIALLGTKQLNNYLDEHTEKIFNENSSILDKTINSAINDSIKYLDKKSQNSIEKMTYQVAKNISDFLYERDDDILLLSKLELNQKTLNTFYKSKKRNIVKTEAYLYNEKKFLWESTNKANLDDYKYEKADLKDNEKEFNLINPKDIKYTSIPVYKEVSFFDLEGNEVYKVSDINKQKVNVFDRFNTYLNAEDFSFDVKQLNQGEIYVSEVIGEYVRTKIIGTFTKEKAKKAGLSFSPENHAYAGVENPVGKKFEGILRFITPVFKNDVRIGYVSLALDHRHLMEFTDTLNPLSLDMKQNISDASVGNYAFMWDYEGKNISHPRDYFIVGYDKTTGKMVPGWVSKDIIDEFKLSNKKNLREFLSSYPKFKNQSLDKKPNIEQLTKLGEVGLDCRYLNFAPQCQGWMQLTKNGGFGSFIIYWSNVWKLTTAATIPYYTGKYKNSKRGFGFVTIGANVDEFHALANKTKSKLEKAVSKQKEHLFNNKKQSDDIIKNYISKITNNLSFSAFIMIILIVFIAIWMSNYITKKISNLLSGTENFSKNKFNHKIKITSNDEIGQLENSFNNMAKHINSLLEEQRELNENLEQKVKKEVQKQRTQEKILIQQSKLASMGEMLGNIAHQWRQPLNALGLIIQDIEFRFHSNTLDKTSLEEKVNKSKLLTKSMSRTIDDFRNFFDPNKEKESFNLKDSLDQSLELFYIKSVDYDILVKENISLISNIYGYKNELIQVILNILLNARDSLKENKVENPEIEITLKKNEKYGVLKIKDNGGGIPENVIDRIFEPYFTTKFNGTGIGLYMSKIIIEENMGGIIKGKNSEFGAEFIIKIPLCLDEYII